jgi:RNA polymerase sigma-70 factor (ECF subfamily)
MFRILVNRATTRGEREGRVRPFSSLASSVGDDGPTVDPDRFEASGRWQGYWTAPPTHREIPEANVLAEEIGGRLTEAIAALPAAQRAVIELRDVQGLTSAEVCELLDLTEANQRVLLHRARARVRQLLEAYLT